MEPLPLHDWHQAHQAAFSELNGYEVVDHYGDAAAEERAARVGCAVFDWSSRGNLLVTGKDRLEFLNSMCTADVKNLAVGSSAYATFLTNKGAMVADGRVWNRGTDVVIDVEPGFTAEVRDYLQKHLVSEDVELQDVSADFAVVSLVGPTAEEAAGAAGIVLRAPSLLPGGVALLVARSDVESTLEQVIAAGAVLAGFAAWETLRVEAGVPRFGQDMDDKTIPLEAGLKPYINYEKGCYVGQEVIARATFRGQVSRQLVKLAFGAEASPQVGAELRSGEREVGKVTSAVKPAGSPAWIGLGYVHRDFVDGTHPLEVAGAGAVTLR